MQPRREGACADDLGASGLLHVRGAVLDAHPLRQCDATARAPLTPLRHYSFDPQIDPSPHPTLNTAIVDPADVRYRAAA